MLKVIIGGYLIGIALAAIGEVVAGTVIGGAFTLVNTVLLVLLNRRTGEIRSRTDSIQADQEATKQALTAPRRIIYDQAGNPIGTVLDLHRGGDWDTWLAQHNRRAEDPPAQ